MKQLAWLILAAGLSLLACTSFGWTADLPLLIEIPETAIVAGPKLSLTDFAILKNADPTVTARLKQLALGAAPLPGQVRIFNRDYLEFLLQQQALGESWQLSMGKQVTIRAEATLIKGSELQLVVDDLLKSGPVVTGLTKRWVELANLPPEIWVEKGTWQIQASPVGRLPQLGLAMFKVTLSNGNQRRVINLNGKIKGLGMGYRTTRELAPMTEIKAGDFERLEIELSGGREFWGNLTQPHRVTKIIPQGELLRSDQIEPIPFAQRGQEVTVLVKGDNFELRLMAIAQVDGGLGQEILVQNPVSHRNFRASVIGWRTVEVCLK